MHRIRTAGDDFRIVKENSALLTKAQLFFLTMIMIGYRNARADLTAERERKNRKIIRVRRMRNNARAAFRAQARDSSESDFPTIFPLLSLSLSLSLFFIFLTNWKNGVNYAERSLNEHVRQSVIFFACERVNDDAARVCCIFYVTKRRPNKFRVTCSQSRIPSLIYVRCSAPPELFTQCNLIETTSSSLSRIYHASQSTCFIYEFGSRCFARKVREKEALRVYVCRSARARNNDRGVTRRVTPLLQLSLARRSVDGI